MPDRMAEQNRIDMLANIIRTADGNHDKGAGALAEAIIDGLTARGYSICLVSMFPGVPMPKTREVL